LRAAMQKSPSRGGGGKLQNETCEVPPQSSEVTKLSQSDNSQIKKPLTHDATEAENRLDSGRPAQKFPVAGKRLMLRKQTEASIA
jgi:hypothetical protein